ncbi:MAG: peptidyl-prolyl cis-trans isomerase, partial [Bacteroidota bacterium]
SALNKNLIVVMAFLLLTLTTTYSQQEEIVAKAGSVSITKEEYVKRFELSPRPRQDNYFDSTYLKKELVKTLIAEKLLAQEAIKSGFDKTKEFLDAYNFMRDFYLRDILYTKEVKSKVTSPDSALEAGKDRIRRTINTKFIFSTDEKEITDIYESIKNGASFDSILAVRPENEEQKNTAEVTFGSMHEKMENVIFNLAPEQVTPIIELKEGWYICKVYSVSIKNSLEEKDISKVKRVVEDRVEDKIYHEFYKNFFKGIVVNADRKLFNSLFEVLDLFLKGNKNTLILYKNKFTIYETEIEKIRMLLDEKDLAKPFIKFETTPVTLSAFLDYMKLTGFDFLRTESGYLKRRLNDYISTYIQNQIVAREALKRGYDKIPEAADDLTIWRDNYLSNLMMKQNFKAQAVTDEEAYTFYSKNSGIIPKPGEVKFSKIVTDDLDVIQKVLEDSEKGADFTEMQRQYSKAADDDLYHPLNQQGDLWKALASISIGEVYGPLKLEDGFAVVKLIDKREGKKELIESFEEAKPQLKNNLQTKKMYDQLDEITAKLAVDNGIQINEQILNSIKVNMINVIVFRRFGFGGQQLAVPYTPNFSTWYEQYERLKKALSL